MGHQMEELKGSVTHTSTIIQVDNPNPKMVCGSTEVI